MKHLLLPVLLALSVHGASAERTPPRPAPLAFEGERVIVRFKADASVMRAHALSAGTSHASTLAARANTIGARHGLALQTGIGISDRSQVMRVEGMSASALVALLASDPDIEAVEPDRRVRRTVVPNDSLFNSGGSAGPAAGQWYLRTPAASVASSIDAVTAWDRTMGSALVVVAVVDTGITSHPDLSGKVLPGYDFISDGDIRNKGTLGANLAPVPDASDPGDWVTDAEVNQVGGTFYHCTSPDSQGRYFGDNSSWHGTQVAGIAGAATNNGQGMAGTGWNVRVLPVRVLGKCFGNTSDIITGMRWAAGLSVPGVPTNPNPAKVINLSLVSDAPCSSEEARAVADINAVGAVVVAAAGNSTGHAAGSPANCPGVIGVAAIRHVGSKVGFSDVGSALSIAAPGGNCVNTSGACLYPILTALNTGTRGPVAASYSDSSNASVGTSFSSPLVAGVAALMISAEPSLTPAAVRAAIQSTARPFPQSGLVDSNNAPLQACRAPDGTDQLECYCTTTTCGAGMLDAGAAVNAVAAAPTQPPATSSGGGGAMSWPWLLALWLAACALMPAMSRRR